MFAWLLFVAAFLFFMVVCYSVIRYYADPVTSPPLATTVVMACVMTSLGLIFMVPVDVYIMSYAVEYSDLVRQGYYGFYALLAALAFIGIPFAYFYSEDYAEDESDRETWVTRTMTASKYTAFSLAIVTLLVLGGLMLEPGSQAHITNQQELVQWVNALMDVHKGARGHRALFLLTAVLTSIGLVNLILYTGYGLMAFPIMLIRGTDTQKQKKLKYDFDQMRIRHRKLELQRKYSQTERLGREDLRELADLNKQERLLRRQGETEPEDDRTWSALVFKALKPFRVALGIALLLLSLVLITGLCLTSVDKAFHSLCGVRCGFVLDKPTVFNPVDAILVFLSRFFPMDYVALGVLALYFFIASVYGIFRIGIRIVGIELYRIEKGATWPQALLLCSLYLMLIIMALTMELLTLAPQYATFGPQLRSDSSQCLVTGNSTSCVISQIATLVAQITVSMPIFSAVFYFGNWAFIAVCVLSGFRESCQKKESEYEDIDGVDEDFELVRLLGPR